MALQPGAHRDWFRGRVCVFGFAAGEKNGAESARDGELILQRKRRKSKK